MFILLIRMTIKHRNTRNVPAQSPENSERLFSNDRRGTHSAIFLQAACAKFGSGACFRSTKIISGEGQHVHNFKAQFSEVNGIFGGARGDAARADEASRRSDGPRR